MTDVIYRPGLEGVIAGETAVSTIAGGLSYRGYSIEDLAENSNFDEVAYLVLYGELPKGEQLAAFRHRLAEAAANVPKEIIETLRRLPADAQMMDVMRSGASLLAHWDPEINDNSREANLRKAERLTGQLPVVMTARHRLRNGQEPIKPDASLSHAANILHMLDGKPPTARGTKAMDVSLILYAEHEFNASAFTARVVCSTLADMHSSITAAIGALKGPLHGGANERVMDILGEVTTTEAAEKWVRAAFANKTKIMGFGHRVYKTGDPRAKYLKTLCGELAAETDNEPIEAVAEVIENMVVGEKKIPPNLDWPSARLYYYMGLPIDLYTPLFVLSRVVGWAAHVIEQHESNRIIRPRANYTGAEPREWTPIAAR